MRRVGIYGPRSQAQMNEEKEESAAALARPPHEK